MKVYVLNVQYRDQGNDIYIYKDAELAQQDVLRWIKEDWQSDVIDEEGPEMPEDFTEALDIWNQYQGDFRMEKGTYYYILEKEVAGADHEKAGQHATQAWELANKAAQEDLRYEYECRQRGETIDARRWVRRRKAQQFLRQHARKAARELLEEFGFPVDLLS